MFCFLQHDAVLVQPRKTGNNPDWDVKHQHKQMIMEL